MRRPQSSPHQARRNANQRQLRHGLDDRIIAQRNCRHGEKDQRGRSPSRHGARSSGSSRHRRLTANRTQMTVPFVSPALPRPERYYETVHRRARRCRNWLPGHRRLHQQTRDRRHPLVRSPARPGRGWDLGWRSGRGAARPVASHRAVGAQVPAQHARIRIDLGGPAWGAGLWQDGGAVRQHQRLQPRVAASSCVNPKS